MLDTFVCNKTTQNNRYMLETKKPQSVRLQDLLFVYFVMILLAMIFVHFIPVSLKRKLLFTANKHISTFDSQQF